MDVGALRIISQKLEPWTVVYIRSTCVLVYVPEIKNHLLFIYLKSCMFCFSKNYANVVRLRSRDTIVMMPTCRCSSFFPKVSCRKIQETAQRNFKSYISVGLSADEVRSYFYLPENKISFEITIWSLIKLIENKTISKVLTDCDQFRIELFDGNAESIDAALNPAGPFTNIM